MQEAFARASYFRVIRQQDGSLLCENGLVPNVTVTVSADDQGGIQYQASTEAQPQQIPPTLLSPGDIENAEVAIANIMAGRSDG